MLYQYPAVRYLNLIGKWIKNNLQFVLVCAILCFFNLTNKIIYMLTQKLYKYSMSSATKLRVMMTFGEAASRLNHKVKRVKGLQAPL